MTRREAHSQDPWVVFSASRLFGIDMFFFCMAEKHKTALVNASLAGTEQSKEGGTIADLKAIFGLNSSDSDSEGEEVGEKVWNA